MGGVDDDFEIVVQLLRDIPSQLPRHNFAWIGVEANNTKVHVVLVVQDTDFGFLRWRLSFEWLSLQKIGYGSGRLPFGVVECPIEFWSPFNASCFGRSTRLLGSGWIFVPLISRLLLGIQ